MAAFDPAASAPVLSYQPVDAGLIPPRTRKY
jgi:hypothetical protein